MFQVFTTQKALADMRETIKRLVAERDRLQAALARLGNAAEDIDRRLDDPRGDGSGDGAQPPTGDDYNELMGLVRSAVRGGPES